MTGIWNGKSLNEKKAMLCEQEAAMDRLVKE